MNRPRIATALLTLCGGGFLLLAAIYSGFTVGLIHPFCDQYLLQWVRESRIALALTGAALLGAAWMTRRGGRMRRFFERPAAVKALLAATVLAAPLLMLELSFRPMARQWARSTVYVEDPDLGWRMRPNCDDVYFGIPVQSNARGLRGPVREYAKPPGTRRILFLGDSVTYGFHLPSHEQTFVHLVERTLNKGPAGPVEAVNAGIDGYSQWQEAAYLKLEGHRYDPDLVVVGFVLNDVTEPLQLSRFGGPGEGFQLANRVRSPFQHLARKSGLLYFAHLLASRRLFGWNVQAGAWQQEVRTVQSLMSAPQDPLVKDAWLQVFSHMQEIVDFCRERNFRLMLVVFPFGPQLELVQPQIPQAMLQEFARINDLPFLDLYPVMADAILRDGHAYWDLFLDPVHFTAAGNEIIAREISAFIEREGLLKTDAKPAPGPGPGT